MFLRFVFVLVFCVALTTASVAQESVFDQREQNSLAVCATGRFSIWPNHIA